MEVPTKREIVEKLEWANINDANYSGSDQYLQGKYEWEGREWNPIIHVVGDGLAFNWKLRLRTGRRKQCRTLEEAVGNCATAILREIEDDVRKHEAEQRKLDEGERRAQEWIDKANNVSIED